MSPCVETELEGARHPMSEDEICRRLVRIWEKLLGVAPIGVNDNYFDLGGESILAIHLFAEIDGTFKVKLPVSVLFEAPTIVELSRIIRHQTPASGRSTLVSIQAEGDRPPFFCFHGAGGNVLIYRELAQCLGSDQPVFGLESQGLDGRYPPLRTVEEMAARYIKEITTAQPHGPYFLGGYCGGGTIAFEAAQQLRALGEGVALLALFDTMNWSRLPKASFGSRLYYSCQRVTFHAANSLRLGSKGKSKFLWGKLRVLRNRLPVWWGMMLGPFGPGAQEGKARSRLLGEIWQANDRACTDYVPKPYDGVVTDFRPMKQYRMFSRPDLKWSQLAQGGENIIVVPVYPAGMLLEPYVRELAALLRRAMDNALCRCEAKTCSCAAFEATAVELQPTPTRCT
jgi:phthiocerol/phenolphthiocerol synthesis type-I polyketide synthase E